MTDTNDIVKKRMNLHNLLDRASALQRDLNNINLQIEKERRELRQTEMKLKVESVMGELQNYLDDLKDIKQWSKEKLKLLYKDMSNEEIDMLYERIQAM